MRLGANLWPFAGDFSKKGAEGDRIIVHMHINMHTQKN